MVDHLKEALARYQKRIEEDLPKLRKEAPHVTAEELLRGKNTV